MTHHVESFLNQPVDAAPSQALRALWHASHNDWDAAHEAAQAGSDADCAWVHALLHREEGDTVNAGYWYRRAGKPVCRNSVQQEREAMLATLLSR